MNHPHNNSQGSPKSNNDSAFDVIRVDEKSRKIKVKVMWYNNHVKESIHDMHFVTIVDPVKPEITKPVSPPPRAKPEYELIPFPAELLLDIEKK